MKLNRWNGIRPCVEEEHDAEIKKRNEKYGKGKDEVDQGIEDISTKVLKNKKKKEKKEAKEAKKEKKEKKGKKGGKKKSKANVEEEL